MLHPLMARDVQDVAKAVIGDHAHLRPAMFQHGVGGDGGAVQHEIDITVRNARQRAQLLHAGHHATRRVVGGGGHLVDDLSAAVGIGPDQIGERSTHIDPDHIHGASPC